jgi:hypothetical protein
MRRGNKIQSQADLIHIVITRYAVKLWDDKVLDQDWVDSRRPILKGFALESLLRQKNKNFFWVVYIDSDYYEAESKWIIKEINGIFPVICVKVTGDFYSSFSPQKLLHDGNLRTESTFDGPYITTRLDSDDAIAPTYIHKIQKISLLHKGKFIVDFSLGLYVDLLSYKFRIFRYRSSQTLSYVEHCKAQEVETVYKGHHGYMVWNEKTYRTWNIIPQWLISIHDRNAFNKLEGKRLHPLLVPKWARILVEDFHKEN